MAKSASEAEKHRKLGNEQFAKRNLDSALEDYDKSVLYAPSSSESCAFAYGNRSAVLLEIQAFEECLRDIQRALACDSCPKPLKEKLDRRKTKCESEMNRENLSKLALEKKARNEIPDLYGGSNPVVPGISAKIAMDFSALSGRRLVALEDIDAGSVVIVEKPYTSILLEHTRISHCHHCHEGLPLDFVPCSDCIDVRFCSETCVHDHRAAHAWECGHVERLHQIGLAYLAYKIFSVTAIEDLATYHACSHTASQRALSFDGAYGLKPGEIYNCGYHCVWNLMAHHNDVKRADMEIYERITRPLTQLALTREPWPETVAGLFVVAPSVCADCKAAPETHRIQLASDYLTELFVRLIEILICNAHAISVLVRDKATDAETGKAVERTEEWKIASAIYSTASLMNHSCRPNIFSSFTGKTLVVRTTRKIAAGEEILNCYGPQFGRMLRAERKEALKQQYYFDCHCCACTESEYAEREACFTAVTCPKCPKSTSKTPPSCFNLPQLKRKAGNPMVKDSIGTEYSCTKCTTRIPATMLEENIQKAEQHLKKILDGKQSRSTDMSEVLRSLATLESFLYVHNKSLSKLRDSTAEWFLNEETGLGIPHAVALLELNLFSVEFVFGAESIELANEIIKFLGVVSAAMTQTPDFSSCVTKDGRSRLVELSSSAKKTFEIHYGRNCMQIEELVSLDSLMSS